jgi:hypothetical protein
LRDVPEDGILNIVFSGGRKTFAFTAILFLETELLDVTASVV